MTVYQVYSSASTSSFYLNKQKPKEDNKKH